VRTELGGLAGGFVAEVTGKRAGPKRLGFRSAAGSIITASLAAPQSHEQLFLFGAPLGCLQWVDLRLPGRPGVEFGVGREVAVVGFPLHGGIRIAYTIAALRSLHNSLAAFTLLDNR
jgi:hypothetical protein